MLKNLSLLKYPRYQRIIIAAICVALASQVEVNIFAPGFIVALSAFLLPIFLYFNQDLNPIRLGLAIAIASPVFRGFILLLTHQSGNVINYTIADILFFASYTLIYYLIYWRLTFQNNAAFFLTIIICDYTANILEIGFLTNFHGYTMTLLALVFVIAVIRTTIACLFCFIFHYFQLLIIKSEDHERQYYQFIWVASAVKSEVYFMKKTIGEIEQVTKNAYLLNERLKREGRQEEQQIAYQIAQNVHEIKHSYQNVIKGLGDYFNDSNNAPMKIDDILKIVSSYSQMIIKKNRQNINLVIKNQVHCNIPRHYYLATILSNLILNAIDAIGTQRIGEILIRLVADQGKVIITVTDNGSGIPAEIQDLIFRPGFSTKFDASGDIYRGIGLSNVQTIVQEQFAGTITVASTPGTKTTFTVILDQAALTKEE